MMKMILREKSMAYLNSISCKVTLCHIPSLVLHLHHGLSVCSNLSFKRLMLLYLNLQKNSNNKK